MYNIKPMSCFLSTVAGSETQEVESSHAETPHTVENVTQPGVAVDNSAEVVQPAVETVSEMQETDTNPAEPPQPVDSVPHLQIASSPNTDPICAISRSLTVNAFYKSKAPASVPPCVGRRGRSVTKPARYYE